MSFWRNLPVFARARLLVRTRPALTLSAAAAGVLTLGLCTAGVLALSRGEAAYADNRAAKPVAGPVLRTALLAPPPPISPLPEVVGLQDLTADQALAANQAIPFATLPNPAARPFLISDASGDDQARAQTCLAQAVYYEAGFEPLAGEQAVAQVVLNRVRHPVFPKTVCGVVFQGSDLKTGCQFTFTCDGALDRTPEPVAWAKAQAVAAAALNGYVMKAVGEATHYHTQYVVPYWSPTLVKLTQIGQHIFYRWTGTFGQPPAFGGQYAGNEPGAATDTPAVMQLLPLQKLAVDYAATSPAASGSASEGAASAAEPDPHQAGSKTDAAAHDPETTLILAKAEAPPVTAAPPQVEVKKVFLPAESLLPRPKWKPF